MLRLSKIFRVNMAMVMPVDQGKAVLRVVLGLSTLCDTIDNNIHLSRLKDMFILSG